MEKLTLNIPEDKFELVKKALISLGVDFNVEKKPKITDYKQDLKKISVWSEKSINEIENAKSAFNSLKIEEW